MAKKIKPLGDRILVQRLETEETTSGGLIIPDTAKEKPVHGKIVAVGDGIKNDKGEKTPIDLSVDQTILFGKWSGTEVQHEGENFIIMKESDVLAILV